MNTSAKIFLSTITIAIVGAFSMPGVAQEITATPEIDNAVSTKTHAQVRAELEQAIADKTLIRTEADEQRLAFAGFKSTKSRAQVAAETREAMRLGLIPHNESAYADYAPTAEQLRLIAEAGQRAVAAKQMAAR